MLIDLTTITKLRPMTKNESHSFITLALSAVPDTPQPLTYFDEMGTLPFLLGVIVQRLKPTGLDYSPKAVLMSAMLCDRPGMAVMWAYMLFVGSRDGNPRTFDVLFGQPDSPFAMGIPTEEALHEAWDAQKDRDAPLGNLLDAAETWRLPVAA